MESSLLIVGGGDTEPRVARVFFMFSYVEGEDLKLPAHVHDLIENEGHDAGIDDMALKFDFPAEFHTDRSVMMR